MRCSSLLEFWDSTTLCRLIETNSENNINQFCFVFIKNNIHILDIHILISIYIYSYPDAIWNGIHPFWTFLEDLGVTVPNINSSLNQLLHGYAVSSIIHQVIAYKTTTNFHLGSDQETFQATLLCSFNSHQEIFSLVLICDMGQLDTGSIWK